MDAIRPINESDRLAALRRYSTLSSPPHTPLERITELATHLLGVPLSLISLVDEHQQQFLAPRQFISSIISRADSFCTHAILDDEVLVVCDASSDPRVAHSVLVRDHPHIRFYAGAPLITSDGWRLGTLCVLDTQPRPPLSAAEKATLTRLAAIVMDELNLCLQATLAQKADQALQQSEQRFRSMVQYASDIITLLDADGIIRYQSASIERILGYSPGEMDGRYALAFVHPDDQHHVAARLTYLTQHPGTLVGTEFRFRHANGAWVYLEAIGNNLLYDPAVGHIVVNSRDISQRKRAEEELLLFKAAVEHTNEAIIITDAHLDLPGPQIVFVNPGFEAMTGYQSVEVLGQSPRILQGPKTDNGVMRHMRTCLHQQQPFFGEVVNYRKDGTEFVVEWSISPVQDAQGTISHYVSVQRDITARKRAEQLEADRRDILQMVAENQPLHVIMERVVALLERQHPEIWCAVLLQQDKQLTCVAAPSVPRLLIQALQSRLTPLIHSCETPDCLWKEAAMSSELHAVLHCSQCAWFLEGHQVRACCSMPIVSGRGDVLGSFVMFCHEASLPSPDVRELMVMVSRLAALVIEQRQLLDRLEHYAYHDALTQLPNRLYFEKRFQEVLQQADTTGESVALLFIDLDRFKQVNDSLGHQIGDQLLALVAQRMEHAVRATDLLARLGGDEFALVMIYIDNPQMVQEVAARILAKFQEPFLVAGRQLFLTANIGISLYPHDGTDPTTLQRNADIAMYRVKRRGVSDLQFYSAEMQADLLQPLLEQIELEEHLYTPTLFDELQLYYQPQLDLIHGTIIGVEVLLRWQHPTLGMISPAKFIPAAERTGLIRPIGTWVLREACRQMAAWERAGHPPLFVAVNVSAAQFAEPDFVQTVAHILREHDLEPRWLELELTESLMLSDFELTMRHLTELKELGVSIALDDFGAGNTVLANLQRLPIDSLKIDKSFMDDLRLSDEEVQQTSDMIQTIVNLAHRFGIRTVAEGVETQDQVDIITHTGCDRVQGFWFATPMPAPDFEAILWQTNAAITYQSCALNGHQPFPSERQADT